MQIYVITCVISMLYKINISMEGFQNAIFFQGDT